MLRALLELSRVSNLPTVWTNVLAAWIIASGSDWRWTPALGWLLLGASLIYSAGMILNDACDAVWDRDHRPERPIPSGRIRLRMVWIIGLTWLLGGAATMILLGGASWLMTLLLLGAIVAYDVYHKPWAGSVIVMGACRTLLYLAVGSAHRSGAGIAFFVESQEAVPWMLRNSGVLLGLYIISLSLVARSESKGVVGRISRYLAQAFWALPIVWSILLFIPASKGIHPPVIWLWLPIGCYVGWLLFSVRQLRVGPRGIGTAVGCLLAGIPLVDALMISSKSPLTAAFLCCLPPLLRCWQRWVTAT
ncbi:MAG: UbiA family prenyltransferase [Verrucomicrobiaceae bacterium]|nr:UbiA family prenyltransferase [Verrucomicrobiaceae bacterium]